METIFHDYNSLIQVNWEEEFRKAVCERDVAICERDEARRQVCSIECAYHNYYHSEKSIAECKGWAYLYINEEEKDGNSIS